jgi:dUTP pyrophosphatase
MVKGSGDRLMEKVKLRVLRLEHFRGDLPAYQSVLASGFDVRAQVREPITLRAGQKVLVPTGLSFEIPSGYEIQARPRSGLAAKFGITLLNTPGTIDADYRGEVKVILINLGHEDFVIKDQDRIAQFVLAPVVQADFEIAETLSDTQRGEGGFGSTGISR